jgi:hypothetical protein
MSQRLGLQHRAGGRRTVIVWETNMNRNSWPGLAGKRLPASTSSNFALIGGGMCKLSGPRRSGWPRLSRMTGPFSPPPPGSMTSVMPRSYRDGGRASHLPRRRATRQRCRHGDARTIPPALTYPSPRSAPVCENLATPQSKQQQEHECGGEPKRLGTPGSAGGPVRLSARRRPQGPAGHPGSRLRRTRELMPH